MSIEYKILESPNKNGTLTLKIEDDELAFNHTLIHKKEEFEEFGINDTGIEKINDQKIYHINGHVITFKEFRFISKVIENL